MTSIVRLLKPLPENIKDHVHFKRDMFVEFVATTVFVYAGTLSAVSTGYWLNVDGKATDVGRILPIAFSFGISIMSLAFAIGHITGGNMNPGVSLMLFFKRKMSFPKMISYWVAQLVGALLGSVLCWGSASMLSASLTDPPVGTPPFTIGCTTLSGDITPGNGFLLEFMGSFFFYFVIAQTACDTRGVATSLFPAIPIGMILIVVHVCLIPFTGCGVNPARTFGPSVINCMYGDNCEAVANQDWYWIYYVGPFFAAFCVAEVTTWMEMEVDMDDGMSSAASTEGPVDTHVAKPVPQDVPKSLPEPIVNPTEFLGMLEAKGGEISVSKMMSDDFKLPVEAAAPVAEVAGPVAEAAVPVAEATATVEAKATPAVESTLL